MKHLYITSAILLILTPKFSFSQPLQSKRFGIYILQNSIEEAVQFGAVKNIKTGEVSLTDEEGFFAISGLVGDTLKFHSLGYRDTSWVIPGIWFAMDQKIELKVEPNVYDLPEVDVVRYYSYAHFKQAFKDLRIPKTEKDIAREVFSSWDPLFKEAAAQGRIDAMAQGGSVGLGIGIGGKDKLRLQREAVDKLEEVQDKSQRFNYLVSRANIKHLTEYKGTCLDSFMVFLNTGYNLHYQMEEYDLLSAIINASAHFKALKGNEEWFLNRQDSDKF
ncbi:hypothetical protein SAMN06265379_10979 [Saccharicrinis carchari]|uniref:CarboxypepD_reg-like domain-containing protein n=1 Tax=Saccharicrinis carchari TaxID=1168039 RepID=A0A521EKA4_SACCC|nr:hypothetical protein [Saccharicrinis carchari]SMO84347.1 hypothetical protein SAMN06265379_10979 [Saccharicrinis carchari]